MTSKGITASCIVFMILIYGCSIFKKPAPRVEQQKEPSVIVVPQPIPPVEYEKGAIKLTFTSDPRLNLYDGKAHTLLLCLYELKEPNAFNQVLDEADGFGKLMECSRFDPSVAYAKRVVLQPGSSVKEEIDRAEGAKYLAVAAGYFHLQKERPFRLYKIPAGSMDIEVELGSLNIQNSR